MSKFIIAIDQGTTGTTVIVLNQEAQVVGKAYCEFEQLFPQPGWVEHRPDAIWQSVVWAIEHALSNANITGKDIAAIGITNQRETTLVWHRKTKQPIYNAIVWQDRRTAAFCNNLKAKGHEEYIHKNTGLKLDPYFSASKITWLLDQFDQTRKHSSSGDWVCGTIDSFLLYQLTGAQVCATEPSNASRTMLYNIHNGIWDKTLLSLFNIPEPLLPEIKASNSTFGYTYGLKILPDGIPITAVLGDQQSALFGQGCIAPGQSKCTYGTGAFLLLNTGTKVNFSPHGILTTVAWQMAGKTPCYALEGSTFIAGAAVQWLRDGLGLITEAKQIETLAGAVPDSGGVTFVPALSGLGAPHWLSEARGMITGITRGTQKEHIARATLEGIALQVVDLLDALTLNAGAPLKELHVDGGACMNNLLMQLQADLLQIPVIRPKNIETTVLGVAYIAAHNANIWGTDHEVPTPAIDHIFEPQQSLTWATTKKEIWKEAIVKLQVT